MQKLAMPTRHATVRSEPSRPENGKTIDRGKPEFFDSSFTTKSFDWGTCQNLVVLGPFHGIGKTTTDSELRTPPGGITAIPVARARANSPPGPPGETRPTAPRRFSRLFTGSR